MQGIRVIGVPEHFNLPWHKAIEKGRFSDAGIDLQWRDEPGGTGAMTKALREDETDCAVLLTEGVVADIIKSNPSRIISGYVVSPLIWGIHTGLDNALTHHDEIYTKRYAISRFGSGSHLMPKVDALTQDKSLLREQFHVVGGLDGALKSLKANETDVFYWEKYTTKPYVDAGEIRRIGEFVTPWPCFVIAAREAFIQAHGDALKKMLELIQSECRAFMSKSIISIAEVADRYAQRSSDVERWFHSTVWADHSEINPQTIQNVVYSLNETSIVEASATHDNLVARL